MDKRIKVYHGSEKIVERPLFGEGKRNNDFGLGFYCTASEELAKEWAVSSLHDGFSNCYTLDTEYLNIRFSTGLRFCWSIGCFQLRCLWQEGQGNI